AQHGLTCRHRGRRCPRREQRRQYSQRASGAHAAGSPARRMLPRAGAPGPPRHVLRPHARRPVRRRLCTMPDRSPGEACMAQTLALVTLLVHDYDEALDWFVGRLGFVPVEDRPVPEQGKRWVVIAPPGGRPGCRLLLARASTPDQQSLVGRQLGGRVGFFLETDDLARDHARWQAAGVRFLEAPRREPYGEVVVFADCYGNRWDLLQPAPGHARATPPSLDGVRSGYDRWAAVYDHDANP